MTQWLENPTTTIWQLTPDKLAIFLETDSERGLAGEEVERRHAEFGPNELPEAPPPSMLKLFLSQFTSVIVWVLIGAAVISGLLEDWLDSAAILAIVLLNGVLGFIQEFRAERSLAALRNMSVATARVFREGVLRSIPARELVPGDLTLLEAGDRIPADARLIYTTNFQTQEASLTGESTPVEKGVDVLSQTDLPLAERTNMVFMGTVAVSGKARALVVATALRSELGRIAAMIQKATEAERAETPMQRRLEQFGYTLLWLALACRDGRVPVGLSAWGAGGLDVVDGGESCRGRRSRRVACCRDHHAGVGSHSHGDAPCADPQTARGRNARVRHGHLLRQDRHPHQERNDGDEIVRRRPGVRGHGRRV